MKTDKSMVHHCLNEFPGCHVVSYSRQGNFMHDLAEEGAGKFTGKQME
jgi:hypothetical protein